MDSGKPQVTYLAVSFCKLLSEQAIGDTAKRQDILRATKYRMLRKAMIAHVLKAHVKKLHGT